MSITEEKIKTLIVEDDAFNVILLKKILHKYSPTIEIIAKATNSEEFVDLLFSANPDLILLDIHLGEEKNTLELLSEVSGIQAEIIIISTDESQAIKAINQYPVAGYITKPIRIVQLKKVIEKATKNIQLKRMANKSTGFLSDVLIAVSTAKAIEFLKIEDILYLEADGKYTIFHLIDKKIRVVSKNIGEYEKTLPFHFFFRIHHKYIVNIRKVISINRSEGIYCLLVNGVSLSISKRKQETLRKFLNV
jgi:two-component system LytT family response regulator